MRIFAQSSGLSLEGMPGTRTLEVCLPGSDETVIHVMEGIPTWMGVAGLAAIIVLSHLLINAKSEIGVKKDYWKFNLFRFRPLASLVRLPYFPLIAQSVSIITFFLVVSAGLWGNQKVNIGPAITWTWWWILLIFLILGAGKAFCSICPWEGISSMVTSLSFKSRIKKLGFEYPWPKWARNIFPAIVFFIALTWFELGWDATRSPMMTSILAVTMLSLAALSAIFFEKRAFCRYGCLVGRISGLYALFSPVELRAQSAAVCTSCKTKECIKGSEMTTGCPTFLFPSKLQENSYCTLCTECIRSCPHDNLSIQLRPFATDLFRKTRFRWDEACLAVILLSLTSFHGVTMTPQWTALNGRLRAETGMGEMAAFTLLMGLIILLPIFVFWFGAKLSRWLAKVDAVSAGEIFKTFAYSLIPIALFYHLAHNCMHFFMEAPHLFPLLSDPFGFGWNLFGTAGQAYGPLLSLKTIWYLQIGCIVVGHLWGVVMADRFAKRLYSGRKRVAKSLIPLIATMVLYSSFSVWLVMQPMELRSGM
jgi:polyferredoxin